MSINQFVKMTVFLRLICFLIYDKMQVDEDESGLFILFYLFIYFFFLFIYLFIFIYLFFLIWFVYFVLFIYLRFMQKFKIATKSGRKTIFGKNRQ